MFGIGIPTLNRADLLVPSLEKYATDFPQTDIHVVDNGSQNILPINECFHIYDFGTNLGVAGSWNFLCKKIFEKNDYALIINDDVYLGYDKQLVNEVIDANPNTLIQSHISWSVIIVSKRMYEYIGRFDETFYPAYFEDSDYLYRMKLKGIRQAVSDKLNPDVIRISMTYEKSPEFVNESMKANRQRYIDKWGNIPLLESFLTPYNK
jgi:GT2 family glycosyltransferase